ncbi:hypothetical protein J2Z66_004689 [Paenibacillus eucommiae]|uniref:Uncharacterized protein n=1 Tax=Paenibacillus eucommiae TaxID=1355755 RepID=A0ABS4IZQ6_9BACL|nr:hypothetical protein [Paenibacillus eucommiae]
MILRQITEPMSLSSLKKEINGKIAALMSVTFTSMYDKPAFGPGDAYRNVRVAKEGTLLKTIVSPCNMFPHFLSDPTQPDL